MALFTELRPKRLSLFNAVSLRVLANSFIPSRWMCTLSYRWSLSLSLSLSLSHTLTHTHTHTHTHIHTHTYTHTHTSYTHTLIYTHTHIHTLTHTHTHIHTQSNRLLEWKAFSATVLLTGSYSIFLRCFFWGGISRGN